MEKLKELIANQIPLLDLAIRVINDKQQKSTQADMEGLYKHIRESFNKMQDDIEFKYGKRELPTDLEKLKESRLKEIVDDDHRMTRLNDNRKSVENADGFL